MENKFKKGLILGGLLAAGAVLGLAMTNQGKKLTEDLQGDLKNLAKKLKKNLSQLEDVTKDTFNELVTTVVDEYAKKKALATDAKNKLTTALQSKWREMEEEYTSENNDERSKN